MVENRDAKTKSAKCKRQNGVCISRTHKPQVTNLSPTGCLHTVDDDMFARGPLNKDSVWLRLVWCGVSSGVGEAVGDCVHKEAAVCLLGSSILLTFIY